MTEAQQASGTRSGRQKSSEQRSYGLGLARGFGAAIMGKQEPELELERREPADREGASSSGNRSSGEEQQKGSGEQEEPQKNQQKQQKEQKQQSGGKQQEGGQQEQGGKQEQPSRAEWVVGIACCVVVLAAVGYLFHQALTSPSLPPMVSVQAERILPAGQGYLVELRLVNEGGETAANLMVEGALMRDTVAVERSTATIDFVPAGTERQGGLFFSKDPRLYRLEVRPMGFDRP